MTDPALVALVADIVRGYCLAMRPSEEPISADTVLFGTSGLLDSIGLVSVIVELEQKLSNRVGRDVSLMDDRALSQERSPFRTVQSLADYAEARVSEGGRALTRNDAPLAIVTGARKGIGRHLARHFVETGWRVVGCSRSPDDVPLPGYDHVLADVTDETQVIRFFADVRRRHGVPDVLVNNAGVAALNHALLTPGDTVDRILRTNIFGTILASRECAKLMIARRSGRIVNFTSVAVPLELEGEAVYAASKGAVESFTRVLAREVGPFGITVNAVGPGPTETDLTRGVPPAKMEALVARLAIRRIGTLEDIANVVDFLVSPASGAVTGQTIYLGGP